MTTSAIRPFFTEFVPTQLDDLLFEICQELQLSYSRYKQAEERYSAVASVLESDGSPFRELTPIIYPQGSMKLGTTVKPVEGPHDLDFVCEFEISHLRVDPLRLLDAMFKFLHEHGTYNGMVTRKNRCVRITYADEFYLDIIPACKDLDLGGACIQIPDRNLKGWTPSNPIGYAKWFEDSSEVRISRVLLETEVPIPPHQSADEKKPLQLVVQLIKRWRDLRYDDLELAPISIVLTTLAALYYQGEESVTAGLSSILESLVQDIDFADSRGQRLVVLNPSNSAEDLSERWEKDREAYRAFKQGMRQFRSDWNALLNSPSGAYNALEGLFGESVEHALAGQAVRLQEARRANRLGIQSTGLISGVAAAAVPIRPNVFHGEK